MHGSAPHFRACSEAIAVSSCIHPKLLEDTDPHVCAPLSPGLSRPTASGVGVTSGLRASCLGAGGGGGREHDMVSRSTCDLRRKISKTASHTPGRFMHGLCAGTARHPACCTRS